MSLKSLTRHIQWITNMQELWIRRIETPLHTIKLKKGILYLKIALLTDYSNFVSQVFCTLSELWDFTCKANSDAVRDWTRESAAGCSTEAAASNTGCLYLCNWRLLTFILFLRDTRRPQRNEGDTRLSRAPSHPCRTLRSSKQVVDPAPRYTYY